jgi:HSP20 family protein
MAKGMRYDPFPDLEDMFRGFRPMPVEMPDERRGGPRVKIDVREDDRTYLINAEIPGAEKEHIRVTAEGSRVTVSAEVKRETGMGEGERVLHSERYFGNVYRSFTLDSALVDSAAEAKYSDGVLQPTLPKKVGGSPTRLSVS